MRVLLVNTNRERSPETLLPLGACCVASAAADAGHEVHFLDQTFSRQPLPDLERELRRLRPDVIGLSLRNLDNCDQARPHSYLPEARALVDLCRRAGDARIVVGGAAVSQAPAALCRFLGADLAVRGEGEVAFPRLLRSLETGEEAARVPGVILPEGPDEAAEPMPVAVVDLLPDPRPERWLDLRRYAAFDASLSVQTKRGCGFHCRYCCYPLLEGSAWRVREPEWVAAQVGRAGALGLRGVEFVDSVFGFPEGHAVACCEAIARARREGERTSLSTLDLNPLACSAELVRAMNAAGFAAVGITAESGSETMLAALGKGFSTDDLTRATAHLRGLQARRLWMFLFGGPGESEATVRESVRFIESLPEPDLVVVTCGIRVLPGTQLHQSLLREGTLSTEADLLQPTFYHSPHVTPERVHALLAESRFPSSHIASLTDCGHRWAPAVQRLAAAVGLRPPYWRGLPLINLARRALRV